MEKTEVPYVEMPATNGYVILIDKEDYDKLPTKVWRVANRGWTQCVLSYGVGTGKSALFLTKILVEHNTKYQRVIFKNGNRLDYRRANLELAKKNGMGTNNATSIKRSKAPDTFELNGCILRKGKTSQRCEGYLGTCPHYSECLDAVSKKTAWGGWTAERIADQKECSKPVPDETMAGYPRRKLKLDDRAA